MQVLRDRPVLGAVTGRRSTLIVEAGASPVFTPAQTESVRGISFGAVRPREDFAWLASDDADYVRGLVNTR